MDPIVVNRRQADQYPEDLMVNHYDGHFNLKLTPQQKRELVEYLKSL